MSESDPIIQVEGLGKKYVISHQQDGRGRYQSLRDTLMNGLRAAGRRLVRPFARTERPGKEEFWALKDVSFEVKRGEVVGIIGRNGAGKSTLLKILSRITEPTTGRVTLHGRVASLLEVGTGFHPELTGRENVYLNGAILGMSRAEIKKKFDAIVAFAEVEKFLDTPVKRYSSGMYMRLAFAVAAHLEPEILVVDEVLAVGDVAFQEKCLGKMQNVAELEGRTVLFVSHNMAAIQHLCARAAMLKGGRLHADGPSAKVIGEYLSDAKAGHTVALDEWKDRSTTGEARITKVEIGDAAGGVAVGGELVIRIHASVNEPLTDPLFGVLIQDTMGSPLLDVRSIHDGLRLGRVIGPLVVEVRVQEIGLYPGRYYLSPYIADTANTRDIDWPHLSCVLEVHRGFGEHGDLKLDSKWGKYYVRSSWKASPRQ